MMARSRAQRQWRDEPYSLVIDSHLRFARHWDRKLVAMLRDLKAAGIRRPALSC